MKLQNAFVRNTVLSAIVGLSLGVFQNGPAQAAEAKFLQAFKDWEAFADAPTGAKFCYIGSKPTIVAIPERRGNVYVLVTHRVKDGVRNEIGFQLGYPLKPDSEVEVTIGEEKFKLFVSGESAWSYDPQGDAALIKAMRAGSEMIVRGQSERGTETVDRYSLSGISAAHELINSACK